jgi:beta-aspartyl-peptidase (threonine type)
MKNWALVIHGGAGIKLTGDRGEQVLHELETIVNDASSILASGGSALDATERAVYLQEDCGIFNAGRGSCLTSEGKVELEAGICRGSDLATGAVFRVGDVVHPIAMARFILEKTDIVSMHGDRAIELVGRYQKLERENLATRKKKELWRKIMADARKEHSFMREFHPKTLKFILEASRYPNVKRMGTVGAVAVDSKGDTAAANSSGGHWLKLPGRIGDSPIFGAGFYANELGAAAATGVGEHMVRSLFCQTVVQGMASRGAQKAVMVAFKDLENRLGANNAGVVAVDRNYGVGVWHNTLGMCHAYLTSKMRAPVVRATANGT